MVPMLVVGSFGGTSFLSHDHDEEAAHTHIGPTHLVAQDLAGWHAGEHSISKNQADCVCLGGCGDGLPTEENEPFTAESPEGLLISIPDHEQMVARGIDLSQTLKTAQVVQCVLAWFWAQPDVSENMGSAGGCDPGGPRHLCALTAGQRLVRTSRALLI